jgi:hypothetical protein
MSDDYLLAEALKNSLLGKRLVYNPITMRYIKNNSTNRKSIIDQIKRARLKSQGIEYYADSEGGNIKISGKSIALIGCSSKKMSGQVRARDMYCSPLFDFSQAWADNRWIDYGILSAEYPELADPESGPNMIIDEYDKKITSLSSKQRKSWAKEVVSNINEPKPATVSILKGGGKLTKKRFKAENKINKIYLLAGKSYTNDLIPELRKKFPDAELIEPLSSMQIGQRLQFLKADKEGFQKAADAQYRPGLPPGSPRGFVIGSTGGEGQLGPRIFGFRDEEEYKAVIENTNLTKRPSFDVRLLDTGEESRPQGLGMPINDFENAYEDYMGRIKKRRRK